MEKVSEHFLQFASVNRGIIDVKKIVKYCRKFRNFFDDFAIQQWRQDTDDPNLLTYDLVRKLDACAERHGPTERLNHKQVKLTLKPWITPDIQSKRVNIDKY